MYKNNIKIFSKLINNIKYPKKGQRSFGINRAQSYGLNEKNYFKNWNDTSTCIIQIETIDGVNNLNELSYRVTQNGDTSNNRKFYSNI